MRTTAYVLRFVKVLRKEKTRREEVTERENAETGERGRSFELSTLELRQAEELWIQAVQKNSFEEELKFLSSNKVSTPPTYLAQFGLYVDEWCWSNKECTSPQLEQMSCFVAEEPPLYQFSHTRSPSSNETRRHKSNSFVVARAILGHSRTGDREEERSKMCSL